jgi:hypothetical protein
MLLQPEINSDVSWKAATSTLPRWVPISSALSPRRKMHTFRILPFRLPLLLHPYTRSRSLLHSIKSASSRISTGLGRTSTPRIGIRSTQRNRISRHFTFWTPCGTVLSGPSRASTASSGFSGPSADLTLCNQFGALSGIPSSASSPDAGIPARPSD